MPTAAAPQAAPGTSGTVAAEGTSLAAIAVAAVAAATAAAALFCDTCFQACITLCHLLSICHVHSTQHTTRSTRLPPLKTPSPRSLRSPRPPPSPRSPLSPLSPPSPRAPLASRSPVRPGSATLLAQPPRRPTSPSTKAPPSSLSTAHSVLGAAPMPVAAPRSHPILDLIECGTSESTLMHTSATNSNPLRRGRAFPPADGGARRASGMLRPRRPSTVRATGMPGTYSDTDDASGGSRNCSGGASRLHRTSTEDGYASAAELTVASVRESVATAVVSLQGQLRKDLQEDELQIFSVLGRGGYGIVYHGTFSRAAAPPRKLALLPLDMAVSRLCTCGMWNSARSL